MEINSKKVNHYLFDNKISIDSLSPLTFMGSSSFCPPAHAGRVLEILTVCVCASETLFSSASRKAAELF